MAEEKSSGHQWLILGGCGFIGRNLVHHLVENKLATKIRVADKSLPATSYLSPKHKASFDQKDIVEFKQADLSRDDHVTRVFKDFQPDFVVNLCGETRFGLSEQDYRVKIVDSATKCAKAAEQAGVKRWVEVSTAQVYSPDKNPSDESAKLKPWTLLAKFRLEAEGVIRNTGLDYVILRPAAVYGSGDLTGITPRIACAAAYKITKEKMKFLWDKDLKINVVHVDDVASAIVLATSTLPSKSLYNLADPSNLTQGVLNNWLGELFGIEVGFVGNILSTMAKLNLSGVAEDANDKHVPVFTKLCADYNIANTPISPFIDKELLYDHHLAVNGEKITKTSPFKYSKQISKDLVAAQVQEFIQQGTFPPVL